MFLEGLHIPLTTPFHPDGRLNTHKLASNIARYSKTPAAGLIVLGPSGEPTLLSDDETREVLRTAAEAAAPEKVLIAGISRDSVVTTLALADYAAEYSYDGVLIGVPSVTIAEREVLTHFQRIADRSPLPIVLSTRRTLTVDTVAGLAAHPNILGLLTSGTTTDIAEILARIASIKREVTVTPTFAAVTTRMEIAAAESPASLMLISADSLAGPGTSVAPPFVMSPPLRTRTKTVGFQIITAHTPRLLDALNTGAVGIAPAFAACAPQACYEIFAAWKDDDPSLAEEKQERLDQAACLAEATSGALKFACELNGYFGGLPRLPHLPPTGAERAALEHLLTPLRN